MRYTRPSHALALLSGTFANQRLVQSEGGAQARVHLSFRLLRERWWWWGAAATRSLAPP